MAAWAGLGYYARARNLLACARAVAADHGGRVSGHRGGPARPAGPRALYRRRRRPRSPLTVPANVVDGNVERVMARLFAVETPLPDAKPELKRLAAGLVARRPPRRLGPGADGPGRDGLPAEVAAVRAVSGAEHLRRVRARATPDSYPRRTAKAERPHRYGVAYVLTRGDEVALVRRPPKGLLGGMLALPTSDWRGASRGATPRRCTRPRRRPRGGDAPARWSTASPTSP